MVAAMVGTSENTKVCGVVNGWRTVVVVDEIVEDVSVTVDVAVGVADDVAVCVAVDGGIVVVAIIPNGTAVIVDVLDGSMDVRDDRNAFVVRAVTARSASTSGVTSHAGLSTTESDSEVETWGDRAC